MKTSGCEVLDLYNHKVFQRFSDSYLLSINGTISADKNKITKQYQKLITLLCSKNPDLKKAHELFETLFKLKISAKIPYIVAINEVNYLKNLITEFLIENGSHEIVLSFVKVSNQAGNICAELYLREYVKSIISLDNARINSMSEILKRNVIIHYKDHLIWLSSLANIIMERDKSDFPERNSALCNFGKWLENEAKNIIHNNSRYKAIVELHDSLHFFADKIYQQFETNDFHAFLSYLEKCEMISLGIGTELALVDNMLMNKLTIKDTLTKALNRNALNQLFESQYEIAFATHNPIIFAMCDLDYFKKINDTYGHIAGDKILVEFVKIVKSKIRNSDIIIRYGGEEFIIILPAIDRNRGVEVLTSIKNAVEAHSIIHDEQEIKATVSMGMIEIIPDDYYNKNKLEEYIAMADKKLYIAKNNGRNQIYT